MRSTGLQSNPRKAAAPKGKLWRVWLPLLLALGALLLWLYRDVRPLVRWEYGADQPPASAFCRTEGATYRREEAQRELGTHGVILQIGGRSVPCLLIVQDTVAPAADTVDLSFPSGYEPGPDQFITDLRDADRVGVRFAEEYDFSPAGEQTVRILLEDSSGNQSEVEAVAMVYATVDRVVVEAGGDAPSVDEFCREGFHGRLLTPITEQMLQEPGEYALEIQCRENGRVFSATLAVEDTAAPAAAGKLLILRPGEEAAPEDFVTDALDATALRYEYALAPDPDSREIQDVLIRVTDAGGNSADVPAQVLYSSLDPVTLEAKNGLITGADLGHAEAEPEPFMADVPGTYPIRVRLGNETEIAIVTLIDTGAPVLSLREGPFYTRHELLPEQLIRAEDVSAVTLSFLQAPDPNSDQPQTFTVRALDAFGNEAAASFSLTLSVDSTPPALYGVVDRTCYVNESVLYLKEAYAQDDVDGRVDVIVDSQVILSQKGQYTVTYTAMDRSGNTASKSCTYTLVEPTVTDEQVHEAAQAVLSKITTEDMVTVEKLRAVFDYLQKRMRFSLTSDKDDWRKEALRAFTTGTGDCFTYYSAARALLDELNVQYLSVTRKSDTSRHYWMIVNVGTGWYHFDTINYYKWNQCFMWTNEQCAVGSNYWKYHEENFPPIATEPFDYDAVVQMEREGLLP